jgi:hypothetical protein
VSAGRFEQLREEARLLAELLEKPEPGLSAWSTLLEERVRAIVDEHRTAQGHTLQNNVCPGCGDDATKPGLHGCTYTYCSLCGS